MTLVERLRQELSILVLMQPEHQRAVVHYISRYEGTGIAKHLTTAIKAQNYWEFNQEKIAWLEAILKEYE